MYSVLLVVLSILGANFIYNNFEKFSNSNNNDSYKGGSYKYENDYKYLENKRLNFNSEKYPPCISLSYEVKKIYNLLDIKGLTKNFEKLFNVYSILLCQKYHASYKPYNTQMLNERINDLEKMISNNFDEQKYKEKLKKYVTLDNSRVSRLILLSYYLIEKEIKEINDSQIINLNNKFYFLIFSELKYLCSS